MRSRRHPLFAAGFAFFLPGGGHLYARRPWTGLVMAAGLVAGFALLFTSRNRALSEAAGGWLLALVACDAIAGVLAARAEARGEHRTRGAQLGRGVVLVSLAIVLGVGGRVVTQVPGMRREAQVAKFKVTCTGDAIVIENRGAEARELDVWNIRVATHSPLGNETYDIGPAHAQRLTLAPGARGTVSPDMAEWLARSCQLAKGPPKTDAWKITDLELPTPTPLYCGFLFSFAARAPGSDGNQLEGFGRCIPATPAHAGASGALELAR